MIIHFSLVLRIHQNNLVASLLLENNKSPTHDVLIEFDNPNGTGEIKIVLAQLALLGIL